MRPGASCCAASQEICAEQFGAPPAVCSDSSSRPPRPRDAPCPTAPEETRSDRSGPPPAVRSRSRSRLRLPVSTLTCCGLSRYGSRGSDVLQYAPERADPPPVKKTRSSQSGHLPQSGASAGPGLRLPVPILIELDMTWCGSKGSEVLPCALMPPAPPEAKKSRWDDPEPLRQSGHRPTVLTRHEARPSTTRLSPDCTRGMVLDFRQGKSTWINSRLVTDSCAARRPLPEVNTGSHSTSAASGVAVCPRSRASSLHATPTHRANS